MALKGLKINRDMLLPYIQFTKGFSYIALQVESNCFPWRHCMPCPPPPASPTSSTILSHSASFYVSCSGLPEVSKTCDAYFCHRAFLLVVPLSRMPFLQTFACLTPYLTWVSLTSYLEQFFPFCTSASLNPLIIYFFSKYFNTICKYIIYLFAKVEA